MRTFSAPIEPQCYGYSTGGVQVGRSLSSSKFFILRKIHYDSSSLTPASIVIIFCNEDMEVLLRSVHSILDRTPPSLLREIILVDDFSSDKSILPVEFDGAGELQSYIEDLPKVRYVRLEKRGGRRFNTPCPNIVSL